VTATGGIKRIKIKATIHWYSSPSATAVAIFVQRHGVHGNTIMVAVAMQRASDGVRRTYTLYGKQKSTGGDAKQAVQTQ